MAADELRVFVIGPLQSDGVTMLSPRRPTVALADLALRRHVPRRRPAGELRSLVVVVIVTGLLQSDGDLRTSFRRPTVPLADPVDRLLLLRLRVADKLRFAPSVPSGSMGIWRRRSATDGRL